MREYISVEDINKVIQSGRKELIINNDIIVTDAARRLAANNGIIIRNAGAVSNNPKSYLESLTTTQFLKNSVVNSAQGVDLLLTNGQVLIPEFGLLRVNIGMRNGKISTLSQEEVPAKEVIDLNGKYVFPGIIDPHVHLGLFAPLDVEVETETGAALIGGITSAGCFFNQPTSYLPFLDELGRLVNAKSNIDILPHLTLRESLHLDEIDMYLNKYGLRSFKMYLNGIPGLLPYQPDAFIVRAMEEVKKRGNKAVICIHAENPSIVETTTTQMLNSKDPLTLEEWGQTHPEIAEEEAVIRAQFFARRLGIKLYLVHVSTGSAMRELRDIKGSNMYVETTSPYLTLSDESNAVNLKMEPPIRNRHNRDELWEAVESGLVDTLGTDNVTMTTKEKQVEKGMNGALPGYSALPTHLPSILNEGYHKRGIALEKLLPLMTINPAKIFGLYPNKGTILPNSDADLVVVDLFEERNVTASTLGSRSDFSIFEGQSIKGWPVMTIKGGKIVAKDGKLTGIRTGKLLGLS